MSVNEVSNATKNAIKRASVYSMPTEPKASGKKESDVKDAMVKPVEMAVDEINRIVGEVNIALNSMQGRVDELEESTFSSDDNTTAVDYTLVDNTVKTFKADNIASVNIKIPSTVAAGFSAQVNFKTGATAPIVTFENLSELSIKRIQYGSLVSQYTAAENAVVRMLIDSDDGQNVFVWIVEVK